MRHCSISQSWNAAIAKLQVLQHIIGSLVSIKVMGPPLSLAYKTEMTVQKMLLGLLINLSL